VERSSQTADAAPQSKELQVVQYVLLHVLLLYKTIFEKKREIFSHTAEDSFDDQIARLTECTSKINLHPSTVLQ